MREITAGLLEEEVGPAGLKRGAYFRKVRSTDTCFLVSLFISATKFTHSLAHLLTYSLTPSLTHPDPPPWLGGAGVPHLDAALARQVVLVLTDKHMYNKVVEGKPVNEDALLASLDGKNGNKWMLETLTYEHNKCAAKDGCHMPDNLAELVMAAN